MQFLESRSNVQGIEDKPEVQEDYLNFKSFCGTYTLDSNKKLVILPKPEKLDEGEHRYIAEKVVEWSTLLGHNIMAQLRFSSPVKEHEAILSYSNLLIELTEIALGEYFPPVIEEEVKISPFIFGSLDVPQTSRHLSQGETLLVSRKIKLKAESLLLLLLIRFHCEMIPALNGFLAEIDGQIGAERKGEICLSMERLAKTNVSYHKGLLMRRQFSPLLGEALETEFEDPEVLEKPLRQASGNPSLKDIVFLWEAYKGGRSLLPMIKELLLGGYTLKPLSKLYELWVLSILTSQLSSITEETFPPRLGGKGSMTFKFKNIDILIELFYNQPSLRNLQKFNNFPWRLRPDYVITIKKGTEPRKIVLITDAKYKETVDSSDVERMLAYLLTYCWSKRDVRAQGVLV